MNVALIGAGNMGLSWAGAALLSGHKVTVIDKDPAKLAAVHNRSIFQGEEPLWRSIDVSSIVTSEKLEDIAGSELVFIAVQTPCCTVSGSSMDSRPVCDYRPLTALLTALAPHLKPGQILLLGSTVFPGAIKNVVMPKLEGTGVEFAYQPVFLRAGSGVTDYLHPPKIVVGIKQSPCLDKLHRFIKSTTWNGAPINWCSYEVAEFVKMVHNTFMCLKINFANEVGDLCKAYGVNSPEEVMRLTFNETREGRLLTLSHMNPGPPFSGTCLPKDSDILQGVLDEKGLYDACQTLASAHGINDDRISRIVDRLSPPGQGVKTVGVLGMSYRPGYNDARLSLAVQLRRRFKLRGWKSLFWDPVFSAMSSEEFMLAARRDPDVEEMYPDVAKTLPELLKYSSSVLVNMPLDLDERLLVGDFSDDAAHTVVRLYWNGDTR